MRTSPVFVYLILALIPPVSPLGKLPEDVVDAVDSEETLTSSDDSESEFAPEATIDVTAPDGPTPPPFAAAPLGPLPAMSVPLARPPGFRPPPSFKPQRDSGEHAEQANVGFVVRRGRAKVMGFSRRKTAE